MQRLWHSHQRNLCIIICQILVEIYLYQLSLTKISLGSYRICFAVGEILLLIGLSVESGHLKNWNRPRPNCLILREGLFSAAGVFSLTTVFLAAGLYLTALRAQIISQEQENVRREVLEASALYATPPSSPPHGITTIARENPITRENHGQQPLFVFPQAFSKHSNLVWSKQRIVCASS